MKYEIVITLTVEADKPHEAEKKVYGVISPSDNFPADVKLTNWIVKKKRPIRGMMTL